MNKWKIAWLATILVILSVGIVWVWQDRVQPVEIINEILPTPTVIERKTKIAVMADIHDDTNELEKMLNKAKGDGVELVVVAGDLTNQGKIDELKNIKKVLDESGLRYEVIPGNHEYYNNFFKSIFGKNYQSVLIGEIKLILVDNGFWQGLGTAQKEWLQSEVKDCRILICIAIMHKPLNNSLSNHVMGENNKTVAAEAVWLRNLLIGAGVRQIESGHLHYATSYELEGIRTDIVGAISRERNNESPRFTELMIGKNSIDRMVVKENNDIRN